MAVHGCFILDTDCVQGLGLLKKEDNLASVHPYIGFHYSCATLISLLFCCSTFVNYYPGFEKTVKKGESQS